MDLNLQHRRIVLGKTGVEFLCKPLSTVAWQRVSAALARSGGGAAMLGDPQWGTDVREILTEHVVSVQNAPTFTPEEGPPYHPSLAQMLDVGMLFKFMVDAVIQLYRESALTEEDAGKSRSPPPTS